MAPELWRHPRRSALFAQLAAMRTSGMSDTAIRRALGLSEREAVEAGIVRRQRTEDRGQKTDFLLSPVLCPLPSGRGPLMAEVLAAVARASGVAETHILGASQGRHLTPLRQLTMYLVRELCVGASLPAIGHFLGRDHTTVHYGCRKAESRLAAEPAFRHVHETARKILAAKAGTPVAAPGQAVANG